MQITLLIAQGLEKKFHDCETRLFPMMLQVLWFDQIMQSLPHLSATDPNNQTLPRKFIPSQYKKHKFALNDPLKLQINLSSLPSSALLAVVTNIFERYVAQITYGS